MNVRKIAAALARAQAPAAALVDVVIRVWLAQLFWAAGMAAVQWLLPGLLVLGLGTRLAALPLLALSLAAYRADPAQDAPLLWALLFGWYAVVGAGPISLDRPISRGIFDSALPLAREAGRALGWVTRAGRPVALLAVRMGIAWVLARHLMAGSGAGLILPVLLAVGLGTRLAALPLLLATASRTMADMSNQHLCWMMLLLLIAACGPGAVSFDHLIGLWVRRRWPEMRLGGTGWRGKGPHVVIVGGGFAGIEAARGLRGEDCAVTLIDRHNYHLFQPLLYQVATAGLSPADIATPIRSLFRDQPNVRVRLGEVVGVDARERQVRLEDGACLGYDVLVLATGARHAYFGRDMWEAAAPGLKTIDDATEIRRRLLLAFELAEAAEDEGERLALLTFVVIGGGPTGVELAGAIAELARHGLEGEFRHIDPATARVLLVEGGPRVLATFPPALSQAAAASLAELGVEVRLGAPVEAVDGGGITLGGERIACATCFWAAGVAASPAAAWLGAPADRAGRLEVGPDLTVAGHSDIFAIGDTASSDGWDGRKVPGLAPAAKQAGAYAARVIAARLRGGRAAKPFRYRHAGSLATIGRRAAVADFGRVRLTGALAWWVWGAVHVLFLAGTRNRIVVAVQWFWAYLTFGRGIRLITNTAK